MTRLALVLLAIVLGAGAIQAHPTASSFVIVSVSNSGATTAAITTDAESLLLRLEAFAGGQVSPSNLPAADRGTYYEGWVWNDDGQGVSIGTFHLRGGNESVVLWSGVDPEDYPSIWVTLEDEDGDPAASERVVLRGRPEES